MLQHGKPVVITEFGCSAYEGAAARGPNGDDIVDWSSTVPTLVGGPVRTEQVQVEYVHELLDIFEAEGVHGAFVFEFIQPAYPHSPDPALDLDMAGTAIVKVNPPGSPRAYDTTGHWARKAAFNALARRWR